LCNTAQYGAVHLSLTQKMPTKKFAKHVQKAKSRKTPAKRNFQNTAKHCFLKKHSQNTAKHPQNTRKTPQNTTKHIWHLLTKQTEFANKPLRSQRSGLARRDRAQRQRGGGDLHTIM